MRYVLKRLFGEEFKTLLLLNLIVTALCLPLVTVGPALLALNGTFIKILDDRCDLDRVREFWGLFRKKFWQGVAYELLFAAYALMLLACQTLGLRLGDEGQALLILTFAMGLAASMVSITLCLILSSVRMPFFQALWNSVLFALGRFPRTLLGTLWIYAMGYLFLLIYPASVLCAAVLMISVTAVVSLSILWTPLDELVLSSCDEEQEHDTI